MVKTQIKKNHIWKELERTKLQCFKVVAKEK